MGHFRKKPVVIDAFQHVAGKVDMASVPRWLVDAMLARTIRAPEGADYLDIHTLEGVMRADRGDWIIRGVKGELYPCKPDIFAATYEPAEDPRP